MQKIRDNNEEKFIGAYVKPPIVGKYEWIYDLDLTSLYPSIIMTLNISPETKIGKIQDWDANKFLKGEVDTYYIGDDSITKENLKEYLENPIFQYHQMVYFIEPIQLVVYLVFLICGFAQRVEYKNEMKKYGKGW